MLGYPLLPVSLEIVVPLFWIWRRRITVCRNPKCLGNGVQEELRPLCLQVFVLDGKKATEFLFCGQVKKIV